MEDECQREQGRVFQNNAATQKRARRSEDMRRASADERTWRDGAGGDRMKQGQASTDIAVTSMEFLLAREQKMLTRKKTRPVKRM